MLAGESLQALNKIQRDEKTAAVNETKQIGQRLADREAELRLAQEHAQLASERAREDVMMKSELADASVQCDIERDAIEGRQREALTALAQQVYALSAARDELEVCFDACGYREIFACECMHSSCMCMRIQIRKTKTLKLYKYTVQARCTRAEEALRLARNLAFDAETLHQVRELCACTRNQHMRIFTLTFHIKFLMHIYTHALDRGRYRARIAFFRMQLTSIVFIMRKQTQIRSIRAFTFHDQQELCEIRTALHAAQSILNPDSGA